VERISKPFGRLQARRVKKYGAEKPALGKIQEESKESESDL
jgi:hypothetical protein